MTVERIFNEVVKRIFYLEQKCQEIEFDMQCCKVINNEKQYDILNNKRRKIKLELDKLREMYRGYKSGL